MVKGKTIPCESIFSNGTDFEWFIEHNCERCKRYRNGRCKVFSACCAAMWDKSKFPYKYLLDYEGYGGKECILFTDKPMKRKKKNRELEGQITFDFNAGDSK